MELGLQYEIQRSRPHYPGFMYDIYHQATEQVILADQKHPEIVRVEEPPAAQHFPRADEVELLGPVEDGDRDPVRRGTHLETQPNRPACRDPLPNLCGRCRR